MRKISTRLAISFLIVALLPALPLSLVVDNLLERRFGPAISDPLEEALEAGLAESRDRLRQQKLNLARQAVVLSNQLDDVSLPEMLEQGAIELPAETDPTWLILLDATGNVNGIEYTTELLANTPNLLARRPQPPSLDDRLEAARPVRQGQYLITAVALARPDTPATLLVVQPLPLGMVDRAGQLTDGLGLVRIVSGETDRVVRSFIAPFLIIYGVLLLVALVAGILWSRRMVRPLEALVAGTRRVGAGDLNTRVNLQAPGEVGDLVDAFDDMVGRLGNQRRDLARLERAAAWRGMARTLAHEVKNPLTPILLAVQETRDRYTGDDPKYQALVDECSEIVREEVESLRRLVREFGDFARLPKPELRQDNLVPLVKDLSSLYGPERLELVIATDAVAGWFDAQALRRVLINLIDNGLAACREAGRAEKVTLKLGRRDCGGCIAVIDQGTGITPENLENIFKPDFTTKDEGMGLGLAIVDSVVAGHGGRVLVESELGRGTTFKIELPLTAPGKGPADTQSNAPQSGENGGR